MKNLKRLILIVCLFVALAILPSCAAEVKLSHQSGFYEEGFDLKLTTDLKNADIYYTLDGSEPTKQSKLYEGPIKILPGRAYDNENVLRATNVKAKAFVKAGATTTDTVCASYFVAEDIKERYPEALVVNLSTNPGNLFDERYGIYTNPMERGKDWRRDSYVEVFDENGKRVVSQNVQIAISGNATRTSRKKTFTLYATDDPKRIQYDFFDGEVKDYKGNTLDEFKRIRLRNGGNDSEWAMLTDIFLQELAKNLKVDTQGYHPAVLFLNGEYWGVYHVRQVYNDNYIEDHYGFPKEDAVVLEAENENPIYAVSEGVDGDEKPFTDAMNFISQNDMTIEKNYIRAGELIDIDNFIDFNIYEAYISNYDWPQNNVKVWRNKNAANGYDTKWRFMVLDTDLGWGFWERYYDSVLDPSWATLSRILYTRAESDGQFVSALDYCTSALRSLMKNAEFYEKFEKRYYELLQTDFATENVYGTLAEIADKVEPLMKENGERWGISMNTWHFHVDKMKEFAKTRTDYAKIDFGDVFGYPSYKVLIDHEQGSATVNDVKITKDNDAAFFDKGTPVTIKAVPNTGYRAKMIVVRNIATDERTYYPGDTAVLDGVSGEVEVFFEKDVPEKKQTVKVSAQFNTVLILTENGDVYGWGLNRYAQIGSPFTGMTTRLAVEANFINMQSFTTPVYIASGIKDISASDSHIMLLTDDGEVLTRGLDLEGQLGHETPSVLTSTGLTGVTQISAGSSLSMALTEDGTLFACGSNKTNIFGSDSPQTVTTFKEIANNVKSISAGKYYGLYITNDNLLYSVGYMSLREGRQGRMVGSNTGVPVLVMENVAYCQTTDSHAIAITQDGVLYGWGKNNRGQFGTSGVVVEPTVVTTGVVSASVSATNLLFYDGEIVGGYGDNTYGQLDGVPTDKTQTSPVFVADKVLDFATGNGFVVYVDASGNVYTAGKNEAGQRANGKREFIQMRGNTAYVEGTDEEFEALSFAPSFNLYDITIIEGPNGSMKIVNPSGTKNTVYFYTGTENGDGTKTQGKLTTVKLTQGTPYVHVWFGDDTRKTEGYFWTDTNKTPKYFTAE